MITKERVSAILKLALPISVGVATSYIMVFVDLAMVGRLGDGALAAIGLAGFCFSFLISFVIGFTPVVQGMVARRAGQDSTEAKCLPLNAGLLLIAIIGVPLTLVSYILVAKVYPLLSSDPRVTTEGVPYLKALVLGIALTGICNVFQGYWAGVNKAKVYMLVIIFMTGLNVILNYALIFGNFGAPRLGTAGAGFASTIALLAGCIVYFVVTNIYYRKEGFVRVMPGRDLLSRVFWVGLPKSIQAALFAIGYVVFFWMIGLVGTSELAVTNVLVRITIVLFIFSDALGAASTTLVSRALGAGDPDDANEWGWDAAKLGVIWVTFLGLPIVFFPEWILGLFLSDPRTIEMAVLPAQITGVTSGVIGLIHIFAYTLVSLGEGKRVLLISFVTQWLFFLPAVWVVGPYMNYGLLEIWIVQLIYGLGVMLLLTSLWRSGRWKYIEI